jgi:hypothetical protein
MRRMRGVVATVLGLIFLAGCSDGGTANETLPSTSSTSAAETSDSLAPLGPSDLPLPAAARDRTAAGVEAFTDYYIALINRLQTDLDSSYLRSLSLNCEGCDRIASDADSDSAAGYTYRGGTLALTAKGVAILNDRGGEIAFVVDQAPMEIVDSTGAPVPNLVFAAKTGLPGGLSTVWQKDHWVVSALSFG